MPKAKSEDHCHLCGQYVEVIVRLKHPFVDGKTYNLLCHCCFSIPYTCFYDERTKTFVTFDTWDKSRLHTVEEMVADGFNKKQAEISIKALKKSIKK